MKLRFANEFERDSTLETFKTIQEVSTLNELNDVLRGMSELELKQLIAVMVNLLNLMQD